MDNHAQLKYLDDPSCPIDENDFVTVEQTESLYQLQREVLESVLLSKDTQQVVNKICLLAEQLVPNAVASVMLLDAGKLHVHSAPSIDEAGIARLNGLVPGPKAGSCGTAVYTKEPVFVSNTLNDERWASMVPVAEDLGLRACWSVPIKLEDREVIGSFALTSFESRPPSIFHRRILDTCSYLIGISLRRERLEQRLLEMAYYDDLTGLGNRDKLEIDIQRFLEMSTDFVLVLIGLDRFKSINDTYGHGTGDYVLSQVGKRLSSSCGIALGVYRITGDEFAVVVQTGSSPEEIAGLSSAIDAVLMPPLAYNDAEFFIQASKGFAYSLSSEDSFMELIKRADTAMYAAKESNDQNYAVFTPEMAEKVQGQLQLERDLHKAINNDEFEVYFQPIMESDGKKVHSLEALIRWHHPVNGLIPPNIFIPIAEESGIIHKISTIVVDQVLDFLQMLETDEVPLCRISVNISGREFNPTHIYGLMDKIRSKGLSDCFEFEMLESYLMGNAEDVISLLEEVRSTGISIAIDDFGTGYSSLSYLKKFPIDKIKIDQSLIKDIIFDSNDLAITKAVVAIARSLNLKVVAEGVETEEHSTLLSVVGIDFLQGYHFAKPMPRLEAEQYIKGYHNLA